MKLSSRRKRKIKKALRVAGGLFAIVLFFGLGLLAIQKWESRQTVETAEQTPEGDLYYDGAWYDLRQDLETVLLFGVDKYAEQAEEGIFTNNQQADFLVLLIVDDRDKTCKALPLNRDTMTQITKLDINGGAIDTFEGQLALAHTYGSGGKDSGHNTTRAVSALLYGVPVTHYIGISMDAVAVLADAVGGVPVTVEQDFSQITDQLPMGQVATLTDQLALTFVRSRGGVGEQSNVERMSRQKQFMEAFIPLWKEKCVDQDDRFLVDILSDITPYMTTNCTVEELSQFNESIAQSEFILLDSPAGEAVLGEEFMEFYVEEEALRETVIGLFYEKCE